MGEKVDYTGASFHYYAEVEQGGRHATGGKTHNFSDIKEDVFTETYELDFLDVTPEKFLITLDRSKVDTSKAGTYTVTATIANKDGSKIYGTSSFDIVVKAADEYALGDTNNDGKVDSVDASAILAEYALLSSNGNGKFNDTQKKAADVDKNGKIDSVDASKVLSYYAYASNAKDNVKTIEEYLG